MDERNLHGFTMERVGKRFYGHERLKSKYIPKIPVSAAREYVRMTNDYMKLLKCVMEEELPSIKTAYMEDLHRADAKGIHMDAMTSLISIIHQTFERMERMIVEKQKSYGMRKILEDIANLTNKLSIKEWKKVIKATLGINIMEDYYLGDFYKNAVAEWTSENVDLIKTIPHESLGRVKEIVLDCYENGRTTTTMMKQIQNEYSVSRKRAALIARDQIAKLNGGIQKAQQEDAGIMEYVWSTVGDGRVRESHGDLNGKTFKWSEPPVTENGRRCHPGEDYQCRCIAIPVFNKNTLNLPIAEDDVKVTYT